MILTFYQRWGPFLLHFLGHFCSRLNWEFYVLSKITIMLKLKAMCKIQNAPSLSGLVQDNANWYCTFPMRAYCANLFFIFLRLIHTERGTARGSARGAARGTPPESIMYNFNVAVHTKAARLQINQSGTAEVSGGRFGKSLWKRFFQRAKRHLLLLTNQVPEIWWRIWLRPQETSELVIDFVRDFVYGKLCAKSIFSRQGHLDFLEVGQFTSGAQPKPLFIVK